jgi:parvulin-like peptidyl-prolyl isomerase
MRLLIREGSTVNSNILKGWLKEPMVHFVLLGGLVFVVSEQLAEDVAEENRIVIDNRIKTEIVQEFQQKKRRAPSQQEMDKMLDGWLRNELLYRKGLDMGLAENDPMIRDRIIQKTIFLFKNLAGLKEPSDQQLKQWYQDKAANYQKQPSYDFEHFLLREQDEGVNQRVEAILAKLLAGEEATDFKHLYHSFVGRNRASLSVTFGEEFVNDLDKVKIGEWRKVKSTKGWHLLRLKTRIQQPLPELEQIETVVRKDWQRQQQNDQVVRLIEELRNTYTILNQSS